MSAAKLKWTSAEVRDAMLTVALEGDTPKPWRKGFEATIKRLGHSSGWGEVSLKKETVCVTGVTPGAEEKLRHHLESVIDQANASHPPEGSEESEEGREDGGPDRGPDGQMQERFRSFGE